MKETLVSCFFNLKKFEGEAKERKGMEIYMKHGKFVLSIRKPLVLFADKDIAVECQMIRNKHGLDSITKIIPMDLEDLPYFSLLPRFIECRKTNPMLNGSPTKDTALYTLLTWCKFAFIKQAIEENFFLSKYFAWIDFGITHVANLSYVVKDDIFSNFPDKIKLLYLRNLLPEDLSPNNPEFSSDGGKIEFVKKHYLSLERGIAAAGFITGGEKEWKLFNTLFEKQAMMFLDAGYAASEQQIIPLLVLQNPSLFELYRGDYDAILSNHKNFRMSLYNVTQYTLMKARTSRKNIHPALKVGIPVFRAIQSGTYNREKEDPVHLLTFMNELYALFIFQNDTTSAEKIALTYQSILQEEKYQEARKKLKEEFFLSPP